MKTLLPLVCVARLALAQTTDAEASTLLETPVINAVDEYGGLSATLTEPHCFGDVCLPAGAKVSATVVGKTVTLTRANSPAAFSALGARFAANSEFSVSNGQVAEGRLAAVLNIDGFQVTGPVVLRMGTKPELMEGTLKRPATFHGWSVPAGFTVTQRVPGEWAAEATPDAAPSAVMVRLKKEAGEPSRARAVREAELWRDFELVEPLRVGALTFAPGGWSFILMPDGQRLYSGTLAARIEAGALKVGGGVFVYWCERDGLQEAQGPQALDENPGVTARFTLDGFSFSAARVRVFRDGTSVAGHKGETCTAGALTGYELELARPSCECGVAGPGRRPNLKLDAKGRIIGASRTLREEVAAAAAPCQCNALPPGPSHP
ncbi:MAG: hypothetical protein Q8L14_29250 [Myxococcales bacterium]|nr:hypothetical protein [Myxococcales bacterium]